ncbi:hypothetical protein [Phyllobacterium endophyticum]|nr:hypothetical protein [Phyllobacterium endophyticum]
MVYDKYNRLVGDAADSPIVTDIGSPEYHRDSFEPIVPHRVLTRASGSTG